MKRYKIINGEPFQEVDGIPCNTDYRGKDLTDCYKSTSLRKKMIFEWWTNWKAHVNIGFDARITDMWVSSHTPQFFTLVFKGYALPGGRPFTIAVTASHNYIKYED